MKSLYGLCSVWPMSCICIKNVASDNRLNQIRTRKISGVGYAIDTACVLAVIGEVNEALQLIFVELACPLQHRRLAPTVKVGNADTHDAFCGIFLNAWIVACAHEGPAHGTNVARLGHGAYDVCNLVSGQGGR